VVHDAAVWKHGKDAAISPQPGAVAPNEETVIRFALIAAACGVCCLSACHPSERSNVNIMNTMQHLNPEGLIKNPAFTQAIVVRGPHRVVYVGGQNAVDAAGQIVGRGDIRAQAEQIFKNLETALSAAGAKLEHVAKWNIYIVQGQPAQPGFEVFRRVWGARPNPPTICVLFVAGLANPEFLAEIDAVAVVPE